MSSDRVFAVGNRVGYCASHLRHGFRIKDLELGVVTYESTKYVRVKFDRPEGVVRPVQACNPDDLILIKEER